MPTIELRETILECLAEAQSYEENPKSLQTLSTITKVSPQNRNLLAQTNGAIPALIQLSKSSFPNIQILSLSILFNMSLNPNLKPSLADMDIIFYLNSVILSPSSTEISKLAASLLCSLAMLDKNKAKFGVAGTVQALVKAISQPNNPAVHHLLSTLAELMQFHGNCTVAVWSGAVPVLIQAAESTDGDDLAGTSLSILGLLARFEEGLTSLRETDEIVKKMLEILKGKCMLSKEGAAEILLRLFDDSEGCLREALRLPEFSSVLADFSVRGSGKAREKADLLMKKIMEASYKYNSSIGGDSMFLQW
ncbi:U-box domain-containing 12-like isoform X1 [Olea europaea subsp. europaea]|uniref:U-box domain-containing 12-like isoform X1 n=1 Tax=Olea europaea subsp. europaea TaxID=158383 RepID=A0A8S0RCB1_OLEEU|nr:U-box domain-containing 12-like isoform X1 [Olea europaea subsp. europaea]